MKKMLLLLVAASVSLMASADTQRNVKFHEIRNTVAPGDVLMKNGVLKTSNRTVSATNFNSLFKAVSKVRPLEDGNVKASYQFPGFYDFVGLDDTYIYPLQSLVTKDEGTMLVSMHGPAYVPVTYVNTSIGATQYSWEYQDPAQDYGKLVTSTDKDLTLTHLPILCDFPTLTAISGSNTDEFSAGNYVASYGGSPVLPPISTQSYVDCFVTAADYTTTTQMLGRFGTSDGENSGDFGVLYPKPAAPYAISTILVQAQCEFPAGTELYADVYSAEIDENGNFISMSEKPLGSGYFYAEEDYVNTSTDPEKVSVYNLLFTMIKDDGYDISAFPVTVDSAIAIIFRGYDNEKIVNFDPLVLFDENLENPSYFLKAREGRLINNIYLDINQSGSLDEGDYWPTTLSVCTDATFGWFFPESDRVESTEGGDVVTATTTGETITIPFNSYYYSTATTSSIWSEDGEVDWLDYSLGENADTDVTELTINVDALPSGVTGRKCTITFTPIGSAPYKLTIGQGTVGVESAVVTSAAQVSVVGGNFVVSAPESINAVTVYNVAGQAVATSEIAGNTTVDASSLAKGVYVLRFNDGSTVKVIK